MEWVEGGMKLLLSFDEQLFQQTNGQTGEKLELILQQNAAQPQVDAIWGTPLPSEAFLLKREHAEKFCFHLLKNYWGKVNLFFYDWKGKIICKIAPRFVTSPFLLGFSLKQVGNNSKDIINTIKSKYYLVK